MNCFINIVLSDASFICKFIWLCSGDYDLIFDGIHENALRLQYYDPVMQKTVSTIPSLFTLGYLQSILDLTLYHLIFVFKVKCLDNLEVSDIIHKYIMCTHQMSLQSKRILQSGIVEVSIVNLDVVKSPFILHPCSLSAPVCINHTWSNSSSW